MSKIFRLGIFSFVAVLFIWLMLKKNFSFFDVYLFLALALCATAFLILNVYKDVKEFKTKRTAKSLLPTLCCLAIVAVVVIIVNAANQTNNSPCILQATYDSDPSTSSFNFRKDGTFQWTNGSGLGVFQEEGTYTINDSLITLNKADFDKVIKSKHLKITTSPPWSNNNAGNAYVVQINDKGDLIDSHFVFRIYIDKRKELTN
jgi:hypothetical protein